MSAEEVLQEEKEEEGLLAGGNAGGDRWSASRGGGTRRCDGVGEALSLQEGGKACIIIDDESSFCWGAQERPSRSQLKEYACIDIKGKQLRCRGMPELVWGTSLAPNAV